MLNFPTEMLQCCIHAGYAKGVQAWSATFELLLAFLFCFIVLCCCCLACALFGHRMHFTCAGSNSSLPFLVPLSIWLIANFIVLRLFMALAVCCVNVCTAFTYTYTYTHSLCFSVWLSVCLKMQSSAIFAWLFQSAPVAAASHNRREFSN